MSDAITPNVNSSKAAEARLQKPRQRVGATLIESKKNKNRSRKFRGLPSLATNRLDGVVLLTKVMRVLSCGAPIL